MARPELLGESTTGSYYLSYLNCNEAQGYDRLLMLLRLLFSRPV